MIHQTGPRSTWCEYEQDPAQNFSLRRRCCALCARALALASIPWLKGGPANVLTLKLKGGLNYCFC